MMKMYRAGGRSRSSQTGSVLLWAVFASLLTIVTATAFLHYAASSYSGLQTLETREDLVDIQNWALLNMSCTNTVGEPGTTPPACAGSGNPIAILNADGNIIIPVNGEIPIGRGYRLRARCDSCAGDGCQGPWRINIQVKRAGSTKRSLFQLNEWSDLFDAKYQKEHGVPCPIIPL
jgi:hypothetical protein